MSLNIYVRVILVWSLTVISVTGRAINQNSQSPGLRLPQDLDAPTVRAINQSPQYSNFTLGSRPEPALVKLDMIIQEAIQKARKRYERARLSYVYTYNVIRYSIHLPYGEPQISIGLVALVKPLLKPNYYVGLKYEVRYPNRAEPEYDLTICKNLGDVHMNKRRDFEYNSTTVPMTLMEAGNLLRKEMVFNNAQAYLRIPLEFDSGSQRKPYWLLPPQLDPWSSDYWVIDMQAGAGHGAVVARIPEVEAKPDIWMG